MRAQIKNARWELDKTVVRAPADGYLVGFTLRPGQRVSKLAVRGWAAYVDTHSTQVVAWIHQNRLRHVEPGQPAEVTFKLRPGKTYSGTVSSVLGIGAQGQLAPTGNVPIPNQAGTPGPFGVIINLDEGLPASSRLHPGAMGTAAIYTRSGKVTHIIRKVIIRLEAWLNYVNPF